jgi:(p)ppGpp synthase/HD superfamily hydrolase
MRYEVDLVITAQESVDMMRQITEALAREKIFIAGLRKQKNAQTQSDASCEYVFNLEVESTTQLEKVRASLAQISGVAQVARL